MAKYMVVVSSYIDATIKEQQKDITFYLFKTLEELDEYIQKTPIRADTLFFSRDAIPLANTSLNYLVAILERVFFKVDHVVYITEQGSDEISSVKFLIKAKNYDNWEIVEGALTREYVTGIVSGAARQDQSTTKRKAVYRVPKKEYVRNKSRQTSLMEEVRYLDDDDLMQKMPDEKMPLYIPSEQTQVCVSYDIIGDNCEERTLYSFVMGQYLSTHGKTLLLERDWEFHRLGEEVTKSGVDCDIFYVDELYADATKVFDDIRHSKTNLIIVLNRKRMEYNYNFLFNLLYNNLDDYLMFAVREGYYGEEPTESKYTVVFPNKMCDVLDMLQRVNMNFLRHTKFVGIHQNVLTELRMPTADSIRSVIEDILNSQEIASVELLEMDSLKLGIDSNYDLGSALWY